MGIFTLYYGDTDKGDGISLSFTNTRVLSERTGIEYDKLVKKILEKREIITKFLVKSLS